MSGKRLETGIFVGLLRMRPAGAGAMLFITSTTESLKLESGSSDRATSRLAVTGCFASSPNAGQEIPNTSRNKQRVRATGHQRLSVHYRGAVGNAQLPIWETMIARCPQR